MGTFKKPFQVDVASRFGAPMGRHSDPPEDFFAGKVYLERVPFVDGDYDEGGAYWGGGRDVEPVYCAWDSHGHSLFIRAKSLEDAKKKLPANWTYAKSRDGKPYSAYVEEMFQQYMETALWSSSDDEDVPLDSNYQTVDIAKSTRKKMHKDCQRFYEENKAILDAEWPADMAGHEFWLSRNGHGSGFFDSKHGTDETRDLLQDKARAYGEVYLSVYRGKVMSD